MFTCVTSCHMLAVDLLEPWDWSSGQVPDSMQHISSVDPVMICSVLNSHTSQFSSLHQSTNTDNNPVSL